MKLTITITKDYNDCAIEEMEIDDGGKGLYVSPLSESPEDAIIERDLVGCVDVADYMKRAYDAGKRGEDFIVEIVDGDKDE